MGKANKYKNQWFAALIMITLVALSLVIYPKGNKFYFLAQFQTLKLPICSMLLLVYFVSCLFIKGFNKITFSVVDLFMLSFIALIFASAFYALNPKFSFYVGCLWIVYYGIFILFQSNIENEWIRKNVLIALTVSLIISLFCFAYYLIQSINNSDDIFNILNSGVLNKIRLFSGYSRNDASSLLVMATGIPLYYLAKSKSKTLITLNIFFLNLLFLSLLITRSRGSLLAFLIIVIIMFSFFWMKKIVRIKVIFATIATLIFTTYLAIAMQSNEEEYVFLLNPFYGVMSTGGDDRIKLWEISYQLFKEKPILGYGAGSWIFEYQKYGAGDLNAHKHISSYMTTSHNYYVNVFFCNGLIGGVIFLTIMIVLPTLKAVKTFMFDNIKLQDVIYFSGIIAFCIVSLFYGTTYNFDNNFQAQPILFFIFLGSFLKDHYKPVLTFKPFKVVIIILLCMTSANYLMCYHNTILYNDFGKALKEKKYVECEKLLHKIDGNPLGFIKYKVNKNHLWSDYYRSKAQYKKAAEYLSKSIQKHPYNFYYYNLLGELYLLQRNIKSAKEAFEKSLLYNCDYIPASIYLLKCEAILKNKEQFSNTKHNLLYINDFVSQYERNKEVWNQYRSLNKLYRKYNEFSNSINKIQIREKAIKAKH